MTKQILDILRRADEILADDGRWTKFSMAKDSVQSDLHFSSPSAQCFCLEGAVMRAGLQIGASERAGRAAIGSLEFDLNGRMVISFNDDPKTTFGDVKAALRQTINRLQH